MMCAGMAAGLYLWHSRGESLGEFTLLGMLVACSLFLAVGWLDSRRESFLKQACLAWVARKSKHDK
jgi:hypothetical protein